MHVKVTSINHIKIYTYISKNPSIISHRMPDSTGKHRDNIKYPKLHLNVNIKSYIELSV